MTAFRSEEKLYFNGDDYFRSVLASLKAAKQEILVEAYIYEDDEIGQAFDHALEVMAERGLQVRLLVDGVGSSDWIDKKKERLQGSGVSVKVYHPIYFSQLSSGHSFFKNFSIKYIQHLSSFLSHLNRRNHRKVFIVDRQIVYVGSMNITASHSRMVRNEEAWNDVGLQIQSETTTYEIQQIIDAFEYSWQRSRFDLKKIGKNLKENLEISQDALHPNVILNYTKNLRAQSARVFKNKMRNSKERIWIINPYLAPSRSIIAHLKQAAKRGVDVRILLSKKSDIFFMPWVAAAHYKQFLAADVKIFEYAPEFIHAKTMIIDQWGVVGSSNLNQRSLLHDLEIDLVLRSEEAFQELQTRYEQLFSKADRIMTADSTIKSFLGRTILFFLRFWL